MARIKYVGPHDAVDVPGAGTFERGQEAEVDAALAKSLLEQPDNFRAVTTKKTEA